VEQATCDVCPRRCRLGEGAWGFCDVRAAHRGSVQDMYYSAIAWPGIRTRWGSNDPSWGFSGLRKGRVAEVFLPGCNLKCDFCVAPFLSRTDDIRGIRWVEAADLVRAATGLVDVIGISGGEPSVHVEYLVDLFSRCRDQGIHTLLESNGYMTRGTAERLAKCTNYIGIGLKASLDRAFYKSKFGVLQTQPILEAVTVFVESGCEVMLVNLTDPNLWEDKEAFEALAGWIARNLGSENRLVLSSLETKDRVLVSPPEQRQAHLERYRKIAMEAGHQKVFFQVDARKKILERREYLDKIGLYRTFQRLGIHPSEDRW
jgi:pyruvate formate lyase activating enzyme